MCEIVIGDREGSRILVSNFKRRYPDRSDYWDGNWVSSDIDIRSGRFRGIVHACLRTDEFGALLSQLLPLYESLAGRAAYSSLEEWMKIELVGDGKGHITTSGVVIDDHCEGNTLKFNFKFDQTYLQSTIRSLKEFLDKYPIVGKR